MIPKIKEHIDRNGILIKYYRPMDFGVKLLDNEDKDEGIKCYTKVKNIRHNDMLANVFLHYPYKDKGFTVKDATIKIDKVNGKGIAQILFKEKSSALEMLLDFTIPAIENSYFGNNRKVQIMGIPEDGVYPDNTLLGYFQDKNPNDYELEYIGWDISLGDDGIMRFRLTPKHPNYKHGEPNFIDRNIKQSIGAARSLGIEYSNVINGLWEPVDPIPYDNYSIKLAFRLRRKDRFENYTPSITTDQAPDQEL